jgi:hypothetical protein
VAHFVDICVCPLELEDRVPSRLLVVDETLLVGVEFVARGAGFGFERFGDRCDGGFAERT